MAMPRRQLTDRFCLHAKAHEADIQTDYFDEQTSGLALRVSRAGLKSWTYHFTRGGKRARLTFGTYPATSLSAARTQAEIAKGEVEAGKDPRATKRKANTLRAICEEYFEREGSTLRTEAFRKATLQRLVYPGLGDQGVADVRRSEIVRLLDTIEDQSGPVMADQTLAYLRRVFTWHASRSDEFRSPIVPGMARTKPKERARERTLADEELQVVWKVASAPGSTFGAFARFTLLTATRRGEAAQARRSEIAGGDWTIPGARYKTGTDHLIPLSSAAQGVLASVAKVGDCDFIFTTDGKSAISGWSKFKRAFDKAVLAEQRKGDPEAKPLPNWTLHDLRRTARSLMSRAGVPADHAERALGHTMAGVRGTYDRFAYWEEKARAFEALAAEVGRIVKGATAK
jgi:integrase